MAFDLQLLSEATILQAYVKPKKLNVFIADVSGSMDSSMSQLRKDIVNRIENIPVNDCLLFGVFSSKGWFRWICSQELKSSTDYDTCKFNILNELYARNMTCFSEILADTPKTIAPYLSKYEVVTFTFFSDGIPTTYPLVTEDKAIEEAARSLAPYISSGAVLAYSDYADRNRLSKLAQLLNIEFISTNTVEDIGKTFEKVNKQDFSKKKTVRLKDGWNFAFSLSPNNDVTVLSIVDGKVITDEQNFVYVWNKEKNAKGASRKAKMSVKVTYAAALALLLNNQIDDALEVLSNIGDVGIVNALGSALTNAEFTYVENMIREAIHDKNKRFLKGQKVGCLPKEDAFDVMDCLQLLMTDEKCVFFPYHERFQYKRMGRTPIKTNEYPEFIPNRNIGVPIVNILGHATELNLSVRVRIPGHIDVPEEIVLYDKKMTRKECELKEQFPTYIYRTYNIINNARLVVTHLPVRIEDNTVLTKLLQEDCVEEMNMQSKITILDLTKLPLCNRLRGKNSNNFELLAERAYENVIVKNTLKVYKDFYEKLEESIDEDSVEENNFLKIENKQKEYLSFCGIDVLTQAYAPQTKYEEATDVLDVYNFQTKVSLSSSVSMKQLEEQQKKQKFNFIGQIMQEAFLTISKNMPANTQKSIEWLKENVLSLTRISRNQQHEINAQRLAIALTGQWAKTFKEDTAEILVGPKKDHKVTLEFKVVQKKI